MYVLHEEKVVDHVIHVLTCYDEVTFLILCIVFLLLTNTIAPRFLNALATYCIANLVAAFLFLVIWWIHRRRNSLRHVAESHKKLFMSISHREH